jgi:hypothetical protein
MNHKPRATCILFYVESFQHVSPLAQCTWLFSKLGQLVSCGDTPSFVPEGKWIISSIVDSSNHSTHIRDKKRKKKLEFILDPSTSLLFTYSSYRIVVCLEVSRSLFTIRSTGETAIDEILSYLHLMVIQIHNSLQSQQHISAVFISVIVHNSDLNLTFPMWQEKLIRGMDPLLNLSCLPKFVDLIEDFVFQRSSRPYLLEGSPFFEGMSMSALSDAMLYHVNLLPDFACPIAILITSGPT